MRGDRLAHPRWVGSVPAIAKQSTEMMQPVSAIAKLITEAL